MTSTSVRWLLLTYSVPPTPAYARVKVRRRLKQIDALPLKNSVYLLPNTADCLEDFVWLAREIRAMGGSALVTSASLLDGLTDAQAEAGLRGERVTIAGAKAGASRASTSLKKRRWVTRTGVKVDRIGSAWLIRRFIDKQASFRFITPSETPRKDELRFDMFDGEFTHEGPRCTFEVLLHRTGLGKDRALKKLGEIVHDLDIKDAAFGHAETAGIGALIAALVARVPDDVTRLQEGGKLFDELYAAFSAPSSRSKRARR